MHSEPSDTGGSALPTAVKILVAGHFGVGKTTLVSSVSEIKPLRTEEFLSDAGAAIDDVAGVESKSTTTVAMDFGRITIHDDLVLYLFGTPGQDRFSFIWDELSIGAIGAIVLADTRRLDATFPCIDYFEQHGTPFVVAVNCFEDGKTYDRDEIQLALDLEPGVPLVMCDARRRESSKTVLMSLIEHVIALRRSPRLASA